MSAHQCQAATARGRGCRKKAVAFRWHQGREILLCADHVRAACEGRLREART